MAVDINKKHLSKHQQRFKLPDGARQIILVRHGSSDFENASQIFIDGRDSCDPPLLPDGEIQAEAVCKRLADEKFSAIFVTPFQRTHQTAASLIASSGMQPIVVAELREAYMGDWEHDFHIQAATNDDIIAKMYTQENWEVIPNAEPMSEVAARAIAGIKIVVNAIKPNNSAVVFSHAGMIGEICHQATESKRFAFFTPENSSISRLIVHADGRWTLRSFNDVAHLI